MTRVDLIKRLKRKNEDLTERGVRIVLAHLLDDLAEALGDGRRVEIRGFGSFWVALRRERIGRNPMTGESVNVPARLTPRFKAGRELKARVDEGRRRELRDDTEIVKSEDSSA